MSLSRDESAIRVVPDAVRGVWERRLSTGYTAEEYLRDRKHRAKGANVKLSDVVKDGVKDLETQLREIRRNEEDDLGKLADSFDAVAKAADLVAAKIANAETALGEDPGEDEPKADTED